MKRGLAFVVLVFKTLMGRSIYEGWETSPFCLQMFSPRMEGTFVEEDGVKQRKSPVL
jgi:hypothetical protein